MMHSFLTDNKAELIARCKVKVSARPLRAATALQLEDGLPLFLDQLTRTLQAEEAGSDAGLQISGPAGGISQVRSEMGVSAAAHGKQLLLLGFTIDQVVHDYGDMCQAITDLAQECDAPFAIDEFRTLNRCLDNAVAEAVTEFNFQRSQAIEINRAGEANQRVGMLVHELRNDLQTALAALSVLETGTVPITGATGKILKRSLGAMKGLIASVFDAEGPGKKDVPICSLATFVADAREAAMLMAIESGCSLKVAAVDPALGIQVNYQLMQAALANLLNNAFKFTHAHSEIALTAYGLGDFVLISVQDMCGGLPDATHESMFTPFFQRSTNRSGMGLGLSVARRAVESDGGTLTVRNLPGTGCVFTITLPRRPLT